MLETLHNEIAKVCPIVGLSSDGRIDFAPEATVQQRAAATALLNPSQSILDGWKLNNCRLRAKQIADAADGQSTLLRASNLELLQIVRKLAKDLNDIRAAVAASTDFATLKSGIGVLPASDRVTKVEYKAAVKTRIDGGDGD